MTKFNLSIDLFTADVRNATDVASTLRRVANQLTELTKLTTLPWDVYMFTDTIHSGSHRIGTWSVDPGPLHDLPITAENDPDARVHCSCCGQHLRAPKEARDRCNACPPRRAP